MQRSVAVPAAPPATPFPGARFVPIAAMAAAVVLIGGAAIVSLFAGFDTATWQRLGYVGIFVTAVVGSASIALPLPSAAAVIGSAAVLDGPWGIPAWLLIAVVAGAGNTIGELSGYLAGVGGRSFIERQPGHARVARWMQRRGAITLFVLAVIPNPLFDLAGLIAGSARMPLRRFLGIVFAGKIIKNGAFALTGAAGVAAVAELI